MIKKIPKLRGRGVNINKPMTDSAYVINLEVIEEAFLSGETVSPEVLLKKGMIEMKNGKIPAIKILGGGELSKKISFTGVAVSGSAKVKIEKAGGKII